MSAESAKQFHLILVKPSHYDDDGYVIQWTRSAVPSNTMAAIYGLVLDAMERRVLGDNVTIEVTALDETNTRIRVDKLARMVKRSGGLGMVALVGVQTNQFPRAVDLARKFMAKGVQACIGGFHISGCLAMLPDTPPDIKAAIDDGISLFAGELEGRLDRVLEDAYAGRLMPLYNFINDLPGLESQPVPYLPAEVIHRMSSSRTSFDAGRGCPFLCSFCTIINVQGRKSRYRSADDVERIVRSNVDQGIHKFFITDDNFARNKVWEVMFDRLIKLREEDGIDLKLTIQVDTVCHKIRSFIEKAGRAGVEKVFIGLENINPESLNGSRKTQNNITEYRQMLQAWHDVGAVTCAGYILGFPTDTRESILMLSFHSTARIERLHPLDGGLLRRKVRTDRRSGLPLENPIVFHTRYAWETLSKSARLAAMYLSYQRRYRRVMAGRSVARGPDAAMQPAEKGELDSLELFNVTEAARSVVVKMKKKAERKKERRPCIAKPEQVAAAGTTE